MTPLRCRRGLTAATALLVAFAWLAASNHCALAASSQPAHACCHEATPAKPAAPLSTTQCCAAFNVPVPEHAAAPVGHFHVLGPAWFEPVAASTPVEPAGEFPATGPPRAVSFAETVLHRSLPAHAPPIFVA